jgi:hypothetical protein
LLMSEPLAEDEGPLESHQHLMDAEDKIVHPVATPTVLALVALVLVIVAGAGAAVAVFR